MVKSTMEHYSAAERKGLYTCNNPSGPQGHYAEWKELISKGYRLFSKQRNCTDRGQTGDHLQIGTWKGVGGCSSQRVAGGSLVVMAESSFFIVGVIP